MGRRVAEPREESVLVKTACSKAGKRGLAETDASFHHTTEMNGSVTTSVTLRPGPGGLSLVGNGASDSTWAQNIRSVRLSAADCLPYSSAAKSTIHIGPTLSENAWAGGFKGDSRTKGPVYDDVLILDNQLAVITQNTAGFKEKPFNKVASEIAGCQLFGSCYFLLVGRKPVKKGMHELYYFTEKLFMDFVSGQDHAMQLKAMGPRDP